MKPRVNHAEMMRRMRLGDIRTLLRDRWGAMLPDDDAGRDDLYWVALYVSAGPNAYLKMPREIRERAPWMSDDEVADLIDRVNATPHLPSARKLGAVLGVTNALRYRLRIFRITACDMTAAQTRAWRRQKARERARRMRALRGAKPQIQSARHNEPWTKANPPISKATYYRRLAKAKRANGNGNGADHQQSAGNGANLDGWQRNAKLPDEKLDSEPEPEPHDHETVRPFRAR